MTIHGPADGWVESPDGRRFWGRAGAAGLLAVDPDDRVLLQHRAEWSHFGGTWGLPGGARQFDESAVDGALRESGEEAAVPGESLRLLFASELDLGFWSYTTIAARVRTPFTAVVSDAESLELRWVPRSDIDTLPLHPGFATSWPGLSAHLDTDLHLVVDAANVVGSRPDGWWRDRAGAATRLLGDLSAAIDGGLPSALFVDAPASGPGAPTSWWPSTTVVLEGEARQATGPAEGLLVDRADADGDAAVVARVESILTSSEEARVVVVTADRGLAARVERLGADVVGPTRLLDALVRT
ncbi:NUDIX hydrolase [Frigoribacterium faeni]|uniref:8-oxo-dGTP pyrophosphatase MutT (NUDIX family) n=1 Tax=Frigoribacterium faeni TaxID=145483 RepID=A0A7W3PIM0_9MICO|nr:NUDIX domain-containing protein [Frigoribacterium faeni]MBA8813026.1 8-oxo-dGTP pyrophosphatase MutT (NUDIX family) [Frigoribacterium faeni]BFF14204.1 NUDIX domain-containing protein [Microbacterium flavescens]GEK82065.1 NTP pyrophosphohydrolase [Frigoribacterium faeni]